MIKKLFGFVFIFSVLTLINPVVMPAQTGARVEVSFNYTKQSGFSSNQFAVWVEDSQGRYIKTLYATQYTAKGGWQKRENSLPLWVKQSKLAEMSKTQIDAISGPTPKNGTLRYVWDGTDIAGKAVSDGEYRIIVEATLRSENRVVYTARIRTGEKNQSVTAAAQYFGAGTGERGMIGPVTVTY